MNGIDPHSSLRSSETVASHVDVATANILDRLGHGEARSSLRALLDRTPDLIGLQEWGLSRHGLLREAGRVRVIPRPGLWSERTVLRGTADYLWLAPILGGCAIGIRTDRFEFRESHVRVLSRPSRAEKVERMLALRPPRIATICVCHDRLNDRTVSLVNFHLTAGVQTLGRYREDRPLLVARHQEEVRNLNRLVGDQLALGYVVHAAGDSNFDGLRIDGLTSAWDGRESLPGTLGTQRKVDDVHGPGRADSVVLLENHSDHKAVVVGRLV